MIKLKALLKEDLNFATKDAFNAYNKEHKLRPTTKVTVAGKPTTAGKITQTAAPTNEPIKGADMFKTANANPMDTAKFIASQSGLRPDAITQWADINGVNLSTVKDDIDAKRIKGLDLMHAISGTSGNPYSKQLIKRYASNGSGEVPKKEAYSNKFAAWFTGTSLNDVKHPTQGKHQLTPDQIKLADTQYKNKLFKSIQAAVKRGDIDKSHIEKHS